MTAPKTARGTMRDTAAAQVACGARDNASMPGTAARPPVLGRRTGGERRHARVEGNGRSWTRVTNVITPKRANDRARLPAVWSCALGAGQSTMTSNGMDKACAHEVAKIASMGPAAESVPKQENGTTKPKKHLPISRLFAPNPRAPVARPIVGNEHRASPKHLAPAPAAVFEIDAGNQFPCHAPPLCFTHIFNAFEKHS